MTRLFIARIALISSIFAWQLSCANAETATAVFHRMYEFFDAAEGRAGFDQKIVTSLRDQVQLTENITSRYDAATIPPDYVRALALNASILQSAIDDRDSAKSNAAIKLVRDDLALKNSYESSVSGAKETFRGKVQVEIYVKRVAAEVPGLIVGVNPRLWQDSSQIMFPIGPSSPARGAIPPGLYRVFVSMPGGEPVVAQDCSIGLTGKDSEPLTVVLPDGK